MLWFWPLKEYLYILLRGDFLLVLLIVFVPKLAAQTSCIPKVEGWDFDVSAGRINVWYIKRLGDTPLCRDSNSPVVFLTMLPLCSTYSSNWNTVWTIMFDSRITSSSFQETCVKRKYVSLARSTPSNNVKIPY